MTSQGHAYARFQRALKTGNAYLAVAAARDLQKMTLEDALSLCLLLRDDVARYQRAAARWLARYHGEVEAVTLGEMRVVADLMAALPLFDIEAGVELADHFERRGLWRLAVRVRDAQSASSRDMTA